MSRVHERVWYTVETDRERGCGARGRVLGWTANDSARGRLAERRRHTPRPKARRTGSLHRGSHRPSAAPAPPAAEAPKWPTPPTLSTRPSSRACCASQ